MTAHNSYQQGTAEPKVLAMRAQIDGGQGLDRLTTPEIHAVQDRLRARIADPECAEHDRRQAESQLWRCELALSPDYGERVHCLDCQYVQRYQEGCFTAAGEQPRHFVLVEECALPGIAVMCAYCFGMRWGPGSPDLPNAEAGEVVGRRRQRAGSRRARSKRSAPKERAVSRAKPVVLRPGALALGDNADVVDENRKVQRLTIVQPADANAAEGRLSAASPVGQALLGCVADDTVTVTTPRGERRLSVRAVIKRSSGPTEA